VQFPHEDMVISLLFYCTFYAQNARLCQIYKRSKFKNESLMLLNASGVPGAVAAPAAPAALAAPAASGTLASAWTNEL
jgi:hypothetical protein